MDKKGIFITFEGPDGSGKTTVIKAIYEKIKQENRNVVLTREPGGTNNAIAEDIRNILLNKSDLKIYSRTEALLFAASRAQHVHDFIKPNLEEGNIVICDRYIDSSIVYQGYGRKLGVGTIMKINEFAMDGAFPDITFVLMVKPEVGMKRIEENNREKNRLDNESIQLSNEVYNSYKAIIKDDYTGRIIEIDAEKNIDEVIESVWTNIKYYFENNKTINSNNVKNEHKNTSSEGNDENRYFVNLGTFDGLNVSEFKKYITNNTSILEDEILDIYLKDKFSFITLVPNKGEELFTLNNKELNNRVISISVANKREKNREGGRSFGGDRRGGFGGRREGGRSFGGDRRGGRSFGGDRRGGFGGGRREGGRSFGGDRRSSGGYGTNSFNQEHHHVRPRREIKDEE